MRLLVSKTSDVLTIPRKWEQKDFHPDPYEHIMRDVLGISQGVKLCADASLWDSLTVTTNNWGLLKEPICLCSIQLGNHLQGLQKERYIGLKDLCPQHRVMLRIMSVVAF